MLKKDGVDVAMDLILCWGSSIIIYVGSAMYEEKLGIYWFIGTCTWYRSAVCRTVVCAQCPGVHAALLLTSDIILLSTSTLSSRERVSS